MCKTCKKSLLDIENAILIKYYQYTAKTRALYESTDGLAGQPADNRPNSDGLWDVHRTVPYLTVPVDWWPGPPIGNRSVQIRTITWCTGPEPLLTVGPQQRSIPKCAVTKSPVKLIQLLTTSTNAWWFGNLQRSKLNGTRKSVSSTQAQIPTSPCTCHASIQCHIVSPLAGSSSGMAVNEEVWRIMFSPYDND